MPRAPRHSHAHPLLPAETSAKLHALRDRKMAVCLHAFVRGSAELFYSTIEDHAQTHPIPPAPPVWVSGDGHAENIGAIQSATPGVARLALNDLDCAVVGEPAFDLVRLALSMSVATMQLGRAGADVLGSARAVVEGYLAAQQDHGALELPKRLEKLLDHASKETRAVLLDKRAPKKHGVRRFAIGERYLALEPDTRAALAEALATSKGLAAIVGAEVGAPIEIVDLAFRVAGTGSLGCFRAAALVRVRPDDDDDALVLVDVKEAMAAPTPRARDGATPTNDAERIVEAATTLWGPLAGLDGDRAHPPMARLEFKDHSLAMRVLRPQEDKLAVDTLTAEESAPVARALGHVVGRSHGEQLSARDRKALTAAIGGDVAGVSRWLEPLLARLVGPHATAYLEHVARVAADERGERDE